MFFEDGSAARILTDDVEVVRLADGTHLVLRPIRPDDDERLRRMFPRLSRESLYMRFFSPIPKLPERVLRYLTRVDYRDRYAIVAQRGDDVVGVARFDRTAGTNRAEVAVIVEDALQGHGVGRALMRKLAEAARARGVDAFVATVLAENRRALSMVTGTTHHELHQDGSEAIALIEL